MPNPTRFSALAIEQDCRGETFIGEVRSARSEIAARCLAAAMAATRPGAVAFSHSGDLSSLEPADVVILNCYGNLENGMLRAQIASYEPKKIARGKETARKWRRRLSMAVPCAGAAETQVSRAHSSPMRSSNSLVVTPDRSR